MNIRSVKISQTHSVWSALESTVTGEKGYYKV